MRLPFPDVIARALGGVFAVLVELLRIIREALVIPAQGWLAVAELAGVAVLAVWRPIMGTALAAYGRALSALEWAQGRIRPAHGVVAACLAAALALAASQFLDYRGISVGAPAYSGVESVAPAPEVGRERAGTAHAWVMIPLAILALVVVVSAVRGRWRAGRMLVPLGLAVVVISLAVDVPKGLDAGGAAFVYEGVEAVLLEGFWAQLLAGAALACCGPLLSASLRPAGDLATGRRPRGRRSPRPVGSRRVANPTLETSL